jgi:hypothetical protein
MKVLMSGACTTYEKIKFVKCVGLQPLENEAN